MSSFGLYYKNVTIVNYNSNGDFYFTVNMITIVIDRSRVISCGSRVTPQFVITIVIYNCNVFIVLALDRLIEVI
jgi:hypothetical protein